MLHLSSVPSLTDYRGSSASHSDEVIEEIISTMAQKLRFTHTFTSLIPKADNSLSDNVRQCAEVVHNRLCKHLSENPPLVIIHGGHISHHFLLDRYALKQLSLHLDPSLRPRSHSTSSTGSDLLFSPQEVPKNLRLAQETSGVFKRIFERGSTSPGKERTRNSQNRPQASVDDSILAFANGTNALVEYFNDHPEQRPHIREIVKSKIQEHYANFWNCHNGVFIQVKSIEAPTAREMMLAFFSCEDPDIKEFSLKALIELLEGDPITGPSANNLVSLQEKLFECLSSNIMQNFSISLQRLLSKAFALTLELILIHTGKTLNAMEHTLKLELWDRVAKLQSLNVSDDLEIRFWGNYATEAVQRIQTDRGLIENILSRVAQVGTATFVTAQAVATQTVTPKTVYQVFSDLKGALAHIPLPRRWFGTLFAIKRLCYITRHNPEEFSDIVKIIQDLKNYQDSEESPCDQRIYFGVICALESVLLHTDKTSILENGLKLLIQLTGFYSQEIKQRVIVAFVNLYRSERTVLQVAIHQTLELLQVKNDTDLKEIIQHEWQALGDREIDLNAIELEPHEKRLSQNVLKYLIRDLGNIRSESQELNRGVASTVMLCDMVEDAYKEDESFVTLLLKKIYQLQPKAFEPDATGCNLVHIAVSNYNNLILPLIKPEIFGIDINAQNHMRDTPLTLALKIGLVEAVEPLCKMGANPNIIDSHGNTFMHLLAQPLCSEQESLEIFKKLQTAVLQFQYPIELDRLNHLGNSPLMIALEDKNMFKAKALIDLGASPYVMNTEGKRAIDLILGYNWTELLDHAITRNESLITPRATPTEAHVPSTILLAASIGAEQSLVHLLKKRCSLSPDNHCNLTAEEIFGISQMILSHLNNLELLTHFLEYHIEQTNDSREYSKQFELLNYEVQKTPRQSLDELNPRLGISGESAYINASEEFALISSKGNRLTKERLKELFLLDDSRLSSDEILRLKEQRGYFLITDIMVMCCQNNDPSTIQPQPPEESFHTTTIFGVNALTYAVQAKNIPAIECLLQHKVSYLWPQTVSVVGQSCALQSAFKDLHPTIVPMLLEHALENSINISLVDANGWPCWLHAFGLKNKDSLLINNLFTQECQSRTASPCSDFSVSNPEVANTIETIITSLNKLYQHNIIPHNAYTYRDDRGCNLLHLACLFNHTESIPTILRILPDLFWIRDGDDDKHGRIPLETARDMQRMPLVRLLIFSMGLLISDNNEPDLYNLDKILTQFRPTLSLKNLLASDNSLTDLFLLLYQQSWAAQMRQNTQNSIAIHTTDSLYSTSRPIDRNHMSFEQLLDNAQRKQGEGDFELTLTSSDKDQLFFQRTESPLHIAAKEGLEAIFDSTYYDLRLLLIQNTEGNTPLHLAAAAGQAVCVKKILSRCASSDPELKKMLLSQVNDQNQTTLHLAGSTASPQHENTFAVLLEQGADPLILDGEGNSATHYVCKSGSILTLKLLINYCSDEMCENSVNKWELLRPSALRGLSRDILLLRLFSSLNDNQRTPAMISTLHGNIGQLKLMLRESFYEGSNTVESNKRNLCYFASRDLFGYDHVRLAAQAGQLTVLVFLVSQAHLPYRNVCNQKETALHAAVYNSHLECVKFLLNRDSLSTHTNDLHLIHQRDIHGRTPAHALWNRNPNYHKKTQLVSRAHAADQQLNHEVNDPSTVAGSLTSHDSENAKRNQILQDLISKGAKFSAQDNHGKTPWHIMCAYDFSSHFNEAARCFSTKKLTKQLAIQDLSGQDPSHVAAQHNQVNMLKILRHYGNPLNLKDHSGYTPALLAAENSSFSVLEYLIDSKVDLSATLRPKSHIYNPNRKEATLLTILIDTDNQSDQVLAIFNQIRKLHPKLLYMTLKDNSTIFHHIAMRGKEAFLHATLPYMENSQKTRKLLTAANAQDKTPLDICAGNGLNELRYLMENYSDIGLHCKKHFRFFSSAQRIVEGNDAKEEAV